MRKASRSLLVVCAVAVAAFALRRDDRSEEARVRSLMAELRSEGSQQPATPRAVAAALQKAGATGLRLSFDLLASSEAHLRAGAAANLGMLGCRTAVPRLVRLLRDPEPGVQRTVASALGAIADPRALPFLERELTNSDVTLAEAALQAARRIRRARPPEQG